MKTLEIDTFYVHVFQISSNVNLDCGSILANEIYLNVTLTAVKTIFRFVDEDDIFNYIKKLSHLFPADFTKMNFNISELDSFITKLL